jgi:NAD+ diphosphatase
MSAAHVFAGNPLDRVSTLRQDPKWVEEQLQKDSTRFLGLWRLEILVKKDTRALAWGRRGLLGSMNNAIGPVLLGVLDDVAHFALDLSALDEPLQTLGFGEVADFVDVRSAAMQLSAEDSGIAAHARSLMDWHATHRYCPGCGGETSSQHGGAMRLCDDCKAEHFPRVSPVAIMLVSSGDRCLLGRERGWPASMFSALAGFIEPGENIEEAVRREVSEEAGIEVGAVRYASSQPWPFPSSLMIGCQAEALTDEIKVDTTELEEARWFSREEVRASLGHDVFGDPDSHAGASLILPPRMAIARHLVEEWVNDV